MTTVVKRRVLKPNSDVFDVAFSEETFLKSQLRRRWSEDILTSKIQDNFAYMEQNIAYRTGWRKEYLGVCELCKDGSEESLHPDCDVWLYQCITGQTLRKICAYCWVCTKNEMSVLMKHQKRGQTDYVYLLRTFIKAK